MSDGSSSPESTDAVARLHDAIDSWDERIQDSYRRMEHQLASFRDRLKQESPEGGSAHEDLLRELAAKNETIAALEARIQELESKLRATEPSPDAAKAPLDVSPTPASPEPFEAMPGPEVEEPVDVPTQPEDPPEERTPGSVEIVSADADKRRLGELLIQQGLLTPAQLQAALSAQQADPHRRIGDILVDQGLTNEEVIARCLAAQLELPFVDLANTEVPEGVVHAISAHLAGLHKCVPIRKEGDRLVVAMANPLDLIAIEDLELSARVQIDPVVAASTAIAAALRQYYPELQG